MGYKSGKPDPFVYSVNRIYTLPFKSPICQQMLGIFPTQYAKDFFTLNEF